ncbi:MAG TPA: energy transducer TonB [Vicinamibacterales bacterium]|jgi:TonB family protein|nr:energy transducer TonB [Vicinamibacterales bacterium]
MRTLMLAIALSAVVAAQQTVYEPGNGVTLPVVTKQVQPEYTREALDAHIEGTVGVTIVVQNDGKVGEAAVSRSLDPTYGLDKQAVVAAKQWEFKPGTKDGKAVAVRVSLEMTFTLK